MKNLKPSLYTKWIAAGLEIAKPRRDELYEAAALILYQDIYLNQNSPDMIKLSNALKESACTQNEYKFLTHAVDAILKREFKTPLGARSMIVTTLQAQDFT